MTWLTRAIAALLTVGMTVPAWAMRDCCCARSSKDSTTACCVKRAVAVPVKKCCASRIKAASVEASTQANHSCLCLLKASSPPATNLPSRSLGTGETAAAVLPNLVDSLPVISLPTPHKITANLPPPRGGALQTLYCRWLT